MNVAEFIAEAEQLARPGLLLRTGGSGDPVAYWHGIEEGTPCVSFRAESAWLTVVVDEDGGSVVSAEKPRVSSVPLYAQRYISLPPVDAVFLLGSDHVEKFLDTYDWPRSEPFNDNFPGRAAHEYEALWQENCPIYRNDIA